MGKNYRGPFSWNFDYEGIRGVSFCSGKSVDFCYDPGLITAPKTFHIKSISTIFDLMAPFYSASNLISFEPGHSKSFPPQTPGTDMRIICAFFADSVIRVGIGK